MLCHISQNRVFRIATWDIPSTSTMTYLIFSPISSPGPPPRDSPSRASCDGQGAKSAWTFGSTAWCRAWGRDIDRWRFPKTRRTPSYHPFLDRFFHYKLAILGILRGFSIWKPPAILASPIHGTSPVNDSWIIRVLGITLMMCLPVCGNPQKIWWFLAIKNHQSSASWDVSKNIHDPTLQAFSLVTSF